MDSQQPLAFGAVSIRSQNGHITRQTGAKFGGTFGSPSPQRGGLAMSSFEDKLEQKGEQEVEQKMQGDQQQGDQQQADQQQGGGGDQQQGAGDPNAMQDQQDQQ
jgi:hypothetical protein